ncbi:MAG: polyhydroxyalkanoic acid system family protein [Pseudomonadota bacterium]|nr:polyhydroxyalkanoic acid system family protein [Pseudomonadota bacterium]
MTAPLIVDLPHRLGAEEARRRIAGGIGRLEEQIPGGAVVETRWNGDRLDLAVETIGQKVDGSIEVHERHVRIELSLPLALSFFTRAIEAAVRRKGAAMLEDKSGG